MPSSLLVAEFATGYCVLSRGVKSREKLLLRSARAHTQFVFVVVINAVNTIKKPDSLHKHGL